MPTGSQGRAAGSPQVEEVLGPGMQLVLICGWRARGVCLGSSSETSCSCRDASQGPWDRAGGSG